MESKKVEVVGMTDKEFKTQLLSILIIAESSKDLQDFISKLKIIVKQYDK